MVLYQRRGKVVMGRDFFRWFIRLILIIFLMAGCCESFYYLGDMSKDSSNSYQKHRNNRYNYDYGNGY